MWVSLKAFCFGLLHCPPTPPPTQTHRTVSPSNETKDRDSVVLRWFLVKKERAIVLNERGECTEESERLGERGSQWVAMIDWLVQW